jgi:DNA invertase Pin-like site-specific DNA recombinase
VNYCLSWVWKQGPPVNVGGKMRKRCRDRNSLSPAALCFKLLAAVSRKDYDDRRRRQAQGIAKAKAEGRQAGRPVDTERNARIVQMLRDGVSWSSIQRATDCSRSTIWKLAKTLEEATS